MTIFTVTYRYTDDVATRDRVRTEHRDYLRGLADEGFSCCPGRSDPRTPPARCCFSRRQTRQRSVRWSRMTRSPPAGSSPRHRLRNGNR